ncbi:MAG: hypothetical protein BroJett011_01020 [Chloroflexota bacterium]|nr:MAG: hypothetical protein BroJett011_01020 [Chloroflexota bacterium]
MNLKFRPFFLAAEIGLSEMTPEVMGIMMGSSLIGGIVGLAFALIIGSVLGAVGGLIGAVLFGEAVKPA